MSSVPPGQRSGEQTNGKDVTGPLCGIAFWLLLDRLLRTIWKPGTTATTGLFSLLEVV